MTAGEGTARQAGSPQAPTAAATPMARPLASPFASFGYGACSGMRAREPDTSRRCELTPYGVQVTSVARSSPARTRRRDVSDGSTTLMRSTL